MDKEKKRKSNIAGEAIPNATQDPCLDPTRPLKASHSRAKRGQKTQTLDTLSALQPLNEIQPSFVRGNTHRLTSNTVLLSGNIHTHQEGFRLALSPTR